VLIADAVVLPALRRRLRRVSALAAPEAATPDPTQRAPAGPQAHPADGASGPTGDADAGGDLTVGEADQLKDGGVPGVGGKGHDAGDQSAVSEPGGVERGGPEDGTAPNHRRRQSRIARTWAIARGGFTLTVGALVLLAIGTGVYGGLNLPDTAVPQPQSPSIEVDFSPGHAARSPITVGVRLLQSDLRQEGGSAPVTLATDLTGADFAHPGWSMFVFAPPGVHVNGATGHDPRTGLVSRLHDATGGVTAGVYIRPGSRHGGYTALLEWDDLTSGPLQVTGANLVAAFPQVTVVNQTNGGSNNTSTVPTPKVTVQRELDPEGDFTYLGGIPPDHFVYFAWAWKPETSHVDRGIAASSFQVEARSATADEQSHTKELYSGIAFGVAAAAAIAAIQEFLNSARRVAKERRARGHLADEPSAPESELPPSQSTHG